jgi:hypothetical protein
MTPAELLRALAERNIGVTRDSDGYAVLVDPDHQLTHTALLRLRWDRWLIEWALVGSRTGHRWYECDACGEIRLLKQSAEHNGARCWKPAAHTGLTPDCPGSLRLVPLVVPKRPRAKKVKVPRVPLRHLPPAPPTKKKRSGSHGRKPSFPARTGDPLSLIECDAHRGPRWVKTPFVSEWTCGRVVDTDDDGKELKCGLPAVVLGTGELTDVGVATPDGSASSDSLLARLRSSLEDARQRKEAS